MENNFSFPCDKDKAPSVELTASCGIKDYKELATCSVLKTSGAKVGFIVGYALGIMFFAYIALLAFLSGEFAATAVYVLLTAAIALTPKCADITARQLIRNYPNKLEAEYKFFKHHFTFRNDYQAAYIAYDDLSGAIENDRVFLLYALDGSTYVIPKKMLDDEKTAALQTVLKVKLGSKFTVNPI